MQLASVEDQFIARWKPLLAVATLEYVTLVRKCFVTS